MKKIFLLLTLLSLLQPLVAQRTTYHAQPVKLFNQGKEMFLEGNYAGAADLLVRFTEVSDDRWLKEEAAFMLAVASFKRGSDGSGELLKTFIHDHPESVHRHPLFFLIGSSHYDRKEWQTAHSWFAMADLDYLTLTDQEDYSFRLGYTELQLGNREEATRRFGLLSLNSNKYRDAADFYLGYIDYVNSDYTAALRRFQRLKDHPEYREEVAFYTAQATFFEGRLDEAVNLSQLFLTQYPHSEHLREINRVLGNSYFRLEQPTRAIPHYEQYVASATKPLRGDAYFLGLSYVTSGNQEEALKMFQLAVGVADALTQNAQLQLGQTYLRLNRKQEAQMAFEVAARDNYDPQARETAMFNYALLAHDTNFSVFSQSITLFEHFLREFPQSVYTDQVNDILAETFLTTKDYQAALNAINRIQNPGRRILEAKQMVLFQLGAQEFINGNMSRAVDYFNNSIGTGSYDLKARNNAWYWRGESYYRMGNYMQAASDFRQFTQQAAPGDENFAMGWYNLGYAHFKQQQYSQAVTAFERFLTAGNQSNKAEVADALNRVGDCHYFNRQFGEAERYYARAAESNPAVADYAAYQRAFVMGLQRNYQGKITALDNLMRRYPDSQYLDDALYEKSRALSMLNREQEAIAELQKLVSDYPRSPLAGQGGVQLGQLHYNNGNYRESIVAYKRVITNFPGSDDARNALVSLETVYRDMNDIQSYVDYANSVPGGVRITPSRQDSLTYLAAESIYMRVNRADAEASLSRYLQSYPNGAYSSDAHYWLGVIADEKGDKDQALSRFRRVVDAGNVKFLDNALLYASQTEYNNGNYRQALADYTRLATVARNATNKQTAQLGMVRCQSAMNSHHEAARTATELLAGSSLSQEVVTEVRWLRGKAYQQTNEVEKAMDDFRFIANDTRSLQGAEAQFILADTYYRWESYDRAEAQVKEFMQKGTPHQYWLARALILLSDTYRAKGDTFQARQYLESLKSNYQGDEADIQQMISERLSQ